MSTVVNVQLSVGKLHFLPPPTFLTHEAADGTATRTVQSSMATIHVATL